MSEFEKIKSFLETLYGHERNKGADSKTGGFPFLTISRQAGAGGNSLADEILGQLAGSSEPLFQGWARFNQELCGKIADDPSLKKSVEPLLKFEYRSVIQDMMEEMITGTTPQDVVNKKIFQLIRKLAVNGKVILVGRGGVCLTRDLPLGIHVRLVAPLEARIKRISSLLELPHEKSKEFVQEQDKSRERLVKNYFNRNIDDPLLYHAVWNTGIVPVDEIAASILLMIKKKAEVYLREEANESR